MRKMRLRRTDVPVGAFNIIRNIRTVKEGVSCEKANE